MGEIQRGTIRDANDAPEAPRLGIDRWGQQVAIDARIVTPQHSPLADLLAAERAAGRAQAFKEAAEAVERLGNFGDYQRHELTSDFGQPRFAFMHGAIAAIEALAKPGEK